MATDVTRRDLLKLAALLPLMPALTTTQPNISPKVSAPPVPPMDRDFADPQELKTYLDELEQYLSDCVANVQPDAYNLAQEVERRIVELTALCLAIGNRKKLARNVATILLDQMGSADINLGNYYAFSGSNDEYWQEQAGETKKELWNGAGVFPISKQVNDFIDRRSELLAMIEYLFGSKKNPGD